MSRSTTRAVVPAVVWTVAVACALFGADGFTAGAQQPAAVDSADPAHAMPALVKQYCVGCHNARLSTAGLALDSVDFSAISAHADTLEKVVRKLRTGTMPPQ